MTEPTATGPNGEKIVFRGGSWRDVSTGAPVGGASRGQPPINTGVDPSLALRQSEFEYRKARDAEKAEQERLERLAQDEALASSATSIRRTLRILDAIKADASDNEGWGETGTTGNIMRSIPWVANAGKDLERKVEAVKGLNAFTALKDLAAQGVKLTPISNAEIDLAASSVANIDPTLSQGEFLKAIDQAIEFHSEALRKIEGGEPAPPKTTPEDDALIRKYLD